MSWRKKAKTNMKHRVIIIEKAQKSLAKIDQKSQPRILAALFDLSLNPYLGKKLGGNLSGRWSWRVWPYRIVYEIRKKELIVLVIDIGHRQGIY